LLQVIRFAFRLLRLPWVILTMVLIVFQIGKIVGSILWFVGVLPVVRRVAVCRFARRLRRNGLESAVADELIDEYADGLSLFSTKRCEDPSRHA